MNINMSREERIALLDEATMSHWDFGQWIVALVEKAGDYLSMVVGDAAASRGMIRLLAPVGLSIGEFDAETADWRDVLNEAMPDIYDIWPIAKQLNEVAAYAVYGVLLRDDLDAEHREDYLRELVSNAVQFIETSPISQWKLTERPQDIQLTRLVKLAENRAALDIGESVDPASLAEFGGVSEGRVRNMMSGSDRKFGNEGGRIPATDALAWLQGRPEFFDSIWNQNKDDEELPVISDGDDVFFLPVGRDGTPFHPGLVRGGSYSIGIKGSEDHITSFSDALGQLQRMPLPSWRRPNEVGNWGIIRAAEWKRFTSAELHELAKSPNYRVPTRERTSN
jgi:hypothetical protein